MKLATLPPLKECDYDERQPDCGKSEHELGSIIAKNEARPAAHHARAGEPCSARPSRQFSNELIADREDLAYADLMRSIPSFGRPDRLQGHDENDIVADDDCFVSSRTCRVDEFNNRVMRQAKYNMYEPEKIEYGHGIDSRRSIRDSRCK